MWPRLPNKEKREKNVEIPTIWGEGALISVMVLPWEPNKA